MVSGACPDGAADGQCALNSIPTLSEKVDTCLLHRLQRAILYSIAHMDPAFLAALTSITVNKKVYKPTVAEIKDMYYKMYRNGGKDNASETVDLSSPAKTPKKPTRRVVQGGAS